MERHLSHILGQSRLPKESADAAFSSGTVSGTVGSRAASFIAGNQEFQRLMASVSDQEGTSVFAPQIKQLAKGFAYQAFHAAGLAQRVIGRVDHTPILMYHRILPEKCPSDWPFPGLVVDVNSFAQQMQWLAREFQVCTVSELLMATGPLDKPRAAVTFDDGYADNALYAAPILEEAGVRGTFFVTTGFIGGNQRLWFDVAARLAPSSDSGSPSGSIQQRMSLWKSMPTAARRVLLARLTQPSDWYAPERDRAMTVTELCQLAQSGHEIGVHSRTHPILTKTEPDELTREIAGCISDLRSWGIEPKGIAYPNGDYSENVVAAVRSCGLRYGLSTALGWYRKTQSLFSIPRIDVNISRLNGWHKDPVEGLKAELAWLGFRNP